MGDTEPNEKPNRLDTFQLPDGRDELNLAEFPIALLADRPPHGTKTIEFRDQIYDRSTGKEVVRKLTITGCDRYGLPTARDDEVILGLIHLTKLTNNFTDRVVKFKRYELVKLLGWPMDGRSYRRINESLNRWLGVTLRYENAWWDKKQKSWVTRGFHIIDNFELLDGRPSKASGEQLDLLQSQFAWNEVVFRSFQADNLKRLDLDRYFQLNSAISKRMFRFLDKRFYLNRTLKFDLSEFACEHIGLSRSYPPTKLKRHLEAALEELEAIGFLEPLDPDERYTKVQRGKWTIVLIRKLPEADPRARRAKPSELEEELIARGVTPATAVELVLQHSEDRIRSKLEVFDWMREKGDKRILKSPAGFLVKSIRDDYVPPRGYESKADRAKRLEAEKERQRTEAQARIRREAEERAREDAERARIEGFWNSLSVAQQEKLKEDALANANPFFLDQYRKHRGKNASSEERYLRLILDTYIADLLNRGEEKR